MITFNDILNIPYKGNSLPNIFKTELSPDIGVEITINFQALYPGISLSTHFIDFKHGLNSASFTIYSKETTSGAVVKGFIIFILGGVNKDLYKLEKTTVPFVLAATDSQPAKISHFSIGDVTKVSAIATIYTTEAVLAYYMIALAGSEVPSFSELKSQGPAKHTTTRFILKKL